MTPYRYYTWVKSAESPPRLRQNDVEALGSASKDSENEMTVIFDTPEKDDKQ